LEGLVARGWGGGLRLGEAGAEWVAVAPA
jgi:hypothetical protein